jgi:hypothetical protein
MPLRVVPSLLLLFVAACGQKPERLLDAAELGPDEVAVVATSPATRKLELTSPIGLTFSQDLAPDSVRAGTYLDRPPAVLKPAIRGLWRWSTLARLEFVPEENYRPNTRYKLILDTKVAGDVGLSFRGPHSFNFTAQPFAVLQATLDHERLPVAERQYVVKGSFTFNYPVSPDAFQQALTVQLQRRGAVTFSLDTDVISPTMSFTTSPIAAEDRNEKITATVGADLMPAVGEVSLPDRAETSTQIPALERLAIERIELQSRQEQRFVRIDVPTRSPSATCKEACRSSRRSPS